MTNTIDQIWAFVAVDPNDDNEGIPAMNIGDVMHPLICCDNDRLVGLKKMLEIIKTNTDIPKVTLRRFTLVEEISDWENYRIPE